MVDNIQFYNNKAEFYASSIESADISEQLQSFLKYIPEAGKILDGGCGTGRDSLYMLKQGYNVTAFDASEKMAEIVVDPTLIASHDPEMHEAVLKVMKGLQVEFI